MSWTDLQHDIAAEFALLQEPVHDEADLAVAELLRRQRERKREESRRYSERKRLERAAQKPRVLVVICARPACSKRLEYERRGSGKPKKYCSPECRRTHQDDLRRSKTKKGRAQ